MVGLLVGVAGFEPTTSCSQSRRDTGLRYTPRVFFRSQFALTSRIGSANIESNNLSTKLYFHFIINLVICFILSFLDGVISW